MRKCNFEDLIDDYLLNRLDEDKKKKFEEHYFNCPNCFEKMVERDELISVMKHKGDMIFHDERAVEKVKEASGFEKIVTLLTPRQWATAAVSACLLLLVTFSLIFYAYLNPKITSPFFERINKIDIRGGEIKIKLIPPIDIKKAPIKFEWSKAGKDAEYEICICDNGNVLWSAKTKENFIVLPEDVKRCITSDKEYSCEVMAFSPQGRFIAPGDIKFKNWKTE